MFAAATSAASAFFKVSAISQNYVLTGSSSSISSSASSSTSPSPAPTQSSAPFTAGLWRVQEAVHKSNGKRVSVWSFEKKSSALERLGPNAKDRVLEVLKAEASALTRMRHPCVLEMVEPLEETRSEIVFATEPVVSTLSMSIPGSPLASRNSETLDEIEIQKGVLQLAKGLAFLHTSARLVHTNITPDSVMINSAGDWKIAGLGLTIPLLGPDGTPTRWEFPTFDSRLPPSIQRSFDYIAPEYAISEQTTTASDMYSLGCLVYAVHAKNVPPFRNHNSLTSMRSNIGRLEGGGGLAGMEGWDQDLKNLVTSLVTPSPMTRLSSETISSHSFFSSIAVSTLNFLDPSTFTPKPREEKIAFMKGLQSVLPRFSEAMRRRKVLPSLLTEMKDPLLLPSILPNIFSISATLDASQFQQLVLPSLKPLFTVKDPPQNMIVLLENLSELQKKTAKNVFRQDVLPLVYNALESEHAAVQERALAAVPDLCDTIDYAEVQSVLFPRVALVFTKTRILSVKVSTLTCFLALVNTLDQTSLTQKLVPLLAKIKTKEPSVMMATLAVHEAMGRKIDRESIALYLLPQLWQMSVGPLLNVDQFTRFMSIIRVLGDRVDKEHAQHLRDAQRIEDRSAVTGNGAQNVFTGAVDFESLVGASNKAVTPVNGSSGSNGGWEDDVWGSMLRPDTPRSQSSMSIPPAPVSAPISPRSISSTPAVPRLPPMKSSPRTLGATRVASSTPQSPSFSSTLSPISSAPNGNISRQNSLSAATSSWTSIVPTVPSTTSFPPLSPPLSPSNIQNGATSQPLQFPLMSSARNVPQILQPRQQFSSPPPTTAPKPNYNISLEPTPPVVRQPQNFFSTTPLEPQRTGTGATQPFGSASKGKASQDWGGFDPLL